MIEKRDNYFMIESVFFYVPRAVYHIKFLNTNWFRKRGEKTREFRTQNNKTQENRVRKTSSMMK